MFMQNFTQAIQICIGEKFFKFSGRAPRAEFWNFMLFSIIVSIFLTIIDSIIPLPFSLANICSLIMFFPTLAVTVRRLHDLDRTGWFIAMPLSLVIVGAFILLIGFSVLLSQVVSYLGMALMIAGAILDIALLIYMIKKGSSGPNKYGDDPLATGQWG